MAIREAQGLPLQNGGEAEDLFLYDPSLLKGLDDLKGPPCDTLRVRPLSADDYDRGKSPARFGCARHWPCFADISRRAKVDVACVSHVHLDVRKTTLLARVPKRAEDNIA